MSYFVADELIKLKQLMDAGVLTEDEFAAQKQKLLSVENADILLDSSEEDDLLYRLSLTDIGDHNNIEICNLIEDVLKVDSRASVKLYNRLVIYHEPVTLLHNATKQECLDLKAKLDKLNAAVLIESEDGSGGKIESAVDRTPRCPRCGSTAITTGARGVNMKWGLIGASKTVNRCANCGATFKPGSQWIL